MTIARRGKALWKAGLPLLSAAVMVPVTAGPLAETSSAQSLPADPAVADPAPAAMLMPTSAITAPAEVPLDRELECVAKVVRHEAGGQPRAGQLAVAQTIRNRMKSGRFPTTACGVANQPGQFFATAAYNPKRDDAWETAVEVSLEAMAERSGDVVPGAMFFRAAGSAPSAFFRTRPRAGVLGGHVFYR